MKAHDFSYDGVRLSDLGYMICRFGGGGIDTIQNGSEISFNTVPSKNGQQHYLTSSVYEDCITATIQICKNQCDFGTMEISVAEQREIMRWLNSRTFKKLRFIDTDGELARIYYNASFNVSRVDIDGRTVGFELEVYTDRPYALQEPVSIKIENDDPGEVLSYYSESDEEGFLYPEMKMKIKGDGDLTVHSITENRDMVIRGCKTDEVITVSYPIISSSIEEHEVMNDFNWVFYRVSNTFRSSKNEFTVTLPCSIEITYSPVVKIGM